MKNAPEHFDLIVVGGGASGMMAAGRAYEENPNRRILLLEKAKQLGEKLRITGGGRCNITNAEFDTRKLLKHYGEGEQFLYSAFSQFNVKDTFSFFESRGLPLVTQERKRAFPVTEKASDVVQVMEKYVQQTGITIRLNEKVKKIIKNGNLLSGVISNKREYTTNTIILSSGSMSHPETGSTGDSFQWLKDLGHTIITPTPTLVPLSVKEPWVKLLSGVSLTSTKITFLADNIKKFSETGKILFTHFGLSGPLILNSASQVSDLLYSKKVTAQIDMHPEIDLGTLKNKVIEIFKNNPNKLLKNILPEIAPPGLTPAILSILKNHTGSNHTGSTCMVDGDKRINNVTKEEREIIVKLLKNLPLTITGLMDYDRAIVADGGVPLNEIDTKTMRSKIYKNLFIIGDLLHIRRPSGGYSLQLCWTTGFVAGQHAGMTCDL
ncbi:NAD(P)/FAD-dependent oxidoreductase [Candidatus Azambacteria bacterium]|nr:NAD(P)/FAD-dependent oxidoreductase [Candidatus Azambacteria bacterium]